MAAPRHYAAEPSRFICRISYLGLATRRRGCGRTTLRCAAYTHTVVRGSGVALCSISHRLGGSQVWASCLGRRSWVRASYIVATPPARLRCARRLWSTLKNFTAWRRPRAEVITGAGVFDLGFCTLAVAPRLLPPPSRPRSLVCWRRGQGGPPTHDSLCALVAQTYTPGRPVHSHRSGALPFCSQVVPHSFAAEALPSARRSIRRSVLLDPSKRFSRQPSYW